MKIEGSFQHKELAQGKWFKMSLMEQLGNVGSEVSRTFNWKKKEGKSENWKKYFWQSFVRALELIDLTIVDEKNHHRLKEILRMREMLVDFFIYDNCYNSDEKSWQKYFLQFAYAARKNKL